MMLTIVGCSGSFPGPHSPASSYLVTAPHEGRDWHLLLDLGNGALGALQRHLDPFEVDAIFFSHLHPDHCLDLCGLYVMHKYRPTGPPAKAPTVFGPEGTGKRMARAYGKERGDGMSSVFQFAAIHHGEPVTVGPFTVTPYRVNHPVEAYGLRVEAHGRVLAYTGDTDSCDTLSGLLAGCQLALMDSAFVDGRDEVRDIHLSGSRAAQAAVTAGAVERLMLTHIPAWNDPQVCRAQAGAVWPGTVELAEPGASYAV